MKLIFGVFKIAGVFVCLSLFMYQLWEVVAYYLDENIFESTKTHTYTGKWATPVITICPDPAVMDEDTNIDYLR